MGSGGSKQVVVPTSPLVSQEAARSMAEASAAEAARHAQVQRDIAEAEQALYLEGKKDGVSEAWDKVQSEVERQASLVYAQRLLEEENKLSALVGEEVARITKTHARAPLRPTECGAEEAALLAGCTEGKAATPACDAAVAAYKVCSEKVMQKLVRPLTKMQ